MTYPKTEAVPRMGGLDSGKLKPAAKPIEERLQKLVDTTLYAGGRRRAQLFRNFLNGTWLREPLHVVLTDIPIGVWTTAMIFDSLSLIRSGREFEWSADASITLGLAGCMLLRPA